MVVAQRGLQVQAGFRRSIIDFILPAVLGPDSKSQVTVKYVDGKPVGATQIVVSHQHLVESLTSAQVRELVEPYVRKALPQGLYVFWADLTFRDGYRAAFSGEVTIVK